jgi:hypothetical protein
VLRRIGNKQVDVVVLTVHLNKLCLEVSTHVRENGSKSVNCISVKNSISILCDEDQVNVKLKNAVSTVSYLA